jgi:tRNA threonylcarbamoyladenosine biosynthesis protein TsaE
VLKIITTSITTSSRETKRIGRDLAQDILKKGPQKKALVIALIGELGSGKTTFLQGFAKGLHIRSRILSPTFVIMKKFQIPICADSCSHLCRFVSFYHIDCYRIKDAKEILDLGFADIIESFENIIAIEWAERIKEILPNDALILKFKFLDRNKREIKVKLTPLEIVKQGVNIRKTNL